MPDITKLPAIVQTTIVSITTLVSLFATQGLISNQDEKLVTGSASILLPLGYLIYTAIARHSDAIVKAARIRAGQPTQMHGP